MATEVTVPRLGWSMEEGTFCEWLKADGERVEAGDSLFVLEGEKTAQEIESFDAGYLRLPPDAPELGETVVVGQRLAFLADENDLEPWLNAPQTKPAKAQTQAETVQAKPNLSGRTISPRALKVAAELGVDWNAVQGTGRAGRIREQDIRAAAALGQAPTPASLLTGKTEPLTPVRKVIAKRMVAGANLTAPVTLHREVDATGLASLRSQFQQSISDERPVPTYNDILVRLVAESLKSHPLLNSQWREEGVFLPDQIHIALAVDTPAGLVTPVIRDAGQLAIRELAKLTAALVKQLLEGKLDADQMQDATFTVTNLGGHGVDAFTPIINPPQCAVLGVGRISQKAVWLDGQAGCQDRLTLSLTFDHRIVDGAPAAKFLNTLAGYIESPAGELLH
jgi:pyruvate dehydrogenase E2 component (dihydrolipoamide acetyltransferase)